MKVCMFKLGVMVKDKVTGRDGVLTHCQLLPETGPAYYNFQPKGLNKETGEPLDHVWITPSRIAASRGTCTVDLPMEVLGTIVKDKASGYTGTAVHMIVHISGCVHFEVQAKGVLSKTGLTVKLQDFDILRLEGKAIPVLSEKQAEQEKKFRPSPAAVCSATPKIV